MVGGRNRTTRDHEKHHEKTRKEVHEIFEKPSSFSDTNVHNRVILPFHINSRQEQNEKNL